MSSIYRDPIHHDILLDPLAKNCLDTSQMQRLGRVYQLGYAHVVYRGATHTRLSHSVGVYQLSKDFVDALKTSYKDKDAIPEGAIDPEVFLPFPNVTQISNDERWEILRHLCSWAGLLHDIGHVAFGHTLEDEFEKIYENHDSFNSDRIPYAWGVELHNSGEIDKSLSRVFQDKRLYPDSFRKLFEAGIVTPTEIRDLVLLIILHKKKRATGNPKGFKEILKDFDNSMSVESTVVDDAFQAVLDFGDSLDLRHKVINSFVQFLLKSIETHGSAGLNSFKPYMSDIVANTICADYLDYINRDANFLGLDPLKDRRVLSRFWIGRDSMGDCHMCLSLQNKYGKDRLDTSTGVVDLFRRRFRFAEVVYYHKTKASASAMLVKAFGLLGKPPEINRKRKILTTDRIDELISSIPASPQSHQNWLAGIESKFRPGAMLDVEIGDETLCLLLQEQAWEEIRKITAETESTSQLRESRELREKLHGIALLQMLAARNLYKVVATIDASAVKTLSGNTDSDEAAEAAISKVLKLLRDGVSAHTERTNLEAVMAQEAGLSSEEAESAFLLYVPGRKSQAKGIETGALSPTGAITLQEHQSVGREVEELGKKYKELWKIIVFVRPDIHGNTYLLQKAVAKLLRSLGETMGYSYEAGKFLHALEKSCWFACLSDAQRPVADYVANIEQEALKLHKSRAIHSIDDEGYAFPWRILGMEGASDALLNSPISERVNLFVALGMFARRGLSRIKVVNGRQPLSDCLPPNVPSFEELSLSLSRIGQVIGKNAEPGNIPKEVLEYLRAFEIANAHLQQAT